MSFKFLEHCIRLLVNEEVKKANLSIRRSKTLKAGDFIYYNGTIAYVQDVVGALISIQTQQGKRLEQAKSYRKYM